GEYATPFTVGQFQQTALDFSSPPYADVADGNWTVELSAVQGLAHYILDVEVGYEGASGEVTDGT
ncbi:MAG TPA: hypothetical protein VI796_05705, partial [Candidatus Thermoplasmatota archaeon]|nr:hypothetical protein [Candidatus Thermoplasmatota archaeon]